MLPPGLYEAVLTPKGEAVDNPELVTGEWVMRCEARTLDDIRALGGNDLDDERRFAAAARLSEINLALYRAFAQPAVRAMVTPPLAEAMRRMHPLRLSYEMFGPRNPWLAWIDDAAERVRGSRRPAKPGNPLVALQERDVAADRRRARGLAQGAERLAEETFHAIYGTPALQAALGIDTELRAAARARPRKSKLHEALVERRIDELEGRDGARRAGARRWSARCSTSAWRATPPTSAASRRSRRIRDAHPSARQMTLAEFKALVREQYLMLLIDEEAALAPIPALLPEVGRGAPRRLRHAARGHRGAAALTGRRAGRSGCSGWLRSSASVRSW